MILFIFCVVLAYLMGSICSAIIVCRIFNLPDPREEGSKNPGATNVLRIAGKQYAAIVVVADVLKGTIPVLIAKLLGAGPAVLGFTALAAVVGHIYPLFFEFKGGKGVATAIGALLGFHFIVGVLVIATWLLVVNFTRYSSLASIVSITLAPFYSLLVIGNIESFPPLFIIVILILFKHRDNIARLVEGTESKIKIKHSVIEEVMESSHPHEIHPIEEPSVVVIEKPVKPKSTKPKKTTKTKETTQSKEKAKPQKTVKTKERVTRKTTKTSKTKTTKKET